MYIEMLKKLCPIEIKILSIINIVSENESIRNNKEMYIDGMKLKKILNLNDEDYELSILNLFRLKCCEGFRGPENVDSIGGIPIRTDSEIEKFRVIICDIILLITVWSKSGFD